MEKIKEILIAVASALKSCQVTFMDDNSVEIVRFGKPYRVTKKAEGFAVDLITLERSYVRDQGCAYLEKKINKNEGVE